MRRGFFVLPARTHSMVRLVVLALSLCFVSLPAFSACYPINASGMTCDTEAEAYNEVIRRVPIRCPLVQRWTGNYRIRPSEQSFNGECEYEYGGPGGPLVFDGSLNGTVWSNNCPAGADCARMDTIDNTCPIADTGAVLAGTGEERHSETHMSLGRLRFGWTFSSYGMYQAIRLGQTVAYRDDAQYWSHTLQGRIVTGGALGALASAIRPDLQVKRFSSDGWEQGATEGGRDYLEKVMDPSGGTTGWRYIRSAGGIETYDASGLLLQIEERDGYRLTLGYVSSSFGPQLTTATASDGRTLTFQYNANGDLSRVLGPSQLTLEYVFTPEGNLTHVSFVTPSGTTTRQFLYEDSRFANVVTGIVDEDGTRIQTYVYDERARVVSEERAGGANHSDFVYSDEKTVHRRPGRADVEYRHASKGNVRKLSGVSEGCASCGPQAESRAYDPAGFLTEVTDFAGVTSNLTYNSRGLLTQTIEPIDQATDRTIQTDWHANFAVPTERRIYDTPNGLVSKQAWTYNARGQALTAKQIDPTTSAARTNTATYCEPANLTAGTCPLLGLVTSVDGARTDLNDLTTYTYYPSDDPSCAAAPTTCPHRKGDLWKVTNALGQITEILKYDGAGRPLMVLDANGVVTDFEYHPRGWLSARKVRGTDDASETDDQITRIDYFPTGLVQKITLPDGSATTYTYDAAHRLTDITDGEGNKLHYTLDNAGNRTQEDTLGHAGDLLRTLSRVYNQLGQLQTQKDAYAHATGFAYDANGNTGTVTDALNRVTDNDYDPLDRLTQTIQNVGGLNVTTRFQYDARDNLTAVIDPKNLTTGYTYNGLGDLTQLNSPDTGITSYTYDSAGNRQTQTDARGVTTSYTYDALNRLTYVSYPNTALNVTYTYDVANPLCPADERFSLGRLNKLKHATYGTQYCYNRFGQLTRKAQVNNSRIDLVVYGYTKTGQLSRVTYPDGTVADYVRDALGRTTEVGVTRPGGTRQVLLTAATYYPFGPAAEWRFDNGRVFRRSLNQNYQPGFVEDASSGGLSLGYEFDAVGNLSKLRTANQLDPPKRIFGYDALNRLTEARDGAGVLKQGYGYDATGNRESATANGVTTAYTTATDSHRLLQTGTVGRSYDAAGNTIAINGTEREFTYNDAGRMSQVKRNGAVVMNYDYNGKGEQIRRAFGSTDVQIVYDEAGHWLGEYDATGVPLQQVIWLDDLPVGLLIGPASANQPLHYIEADALGTPRRVIDPQRNVAVWNWALTFEPFGAEGPLEDPDGDGAGLVFNLRFPGQRYDAASGLNQNGFRDYDPIGRYVESDPIGLAGGISTYAYVSGQPLILVDPLGLVEIPSPNGVVPGGPWSPHNANRPGQFLGPPGGQGGRAQCQYVPPAGQGGPPGSKGYWKTNQHGQKGWQRFNLQGEPISAGEAHRIPAPRGQGGFVSPTLLLRLNVLIFLLTYSEDLNANEVDHSMDFYPRDSECDPCKKQK